MKHRGPALICLGAVLTYAAADPLPPDQARALREQFQARLQQTRTWSARFTQTLTLPGMRQAVVSGGRLTYRAPGQLRLDFTRPPGEFVLVIDDSVYLQKAGQPLERLSLADDLAAKPFAALLSFLKGDAVEDDQWFTPEITRHDGRYRVVLTRRSAAPDELPKRITNVLDVKSLDVSEVSVELPNGGTLQYRFDGASRNRAVDGTRFMPPVIR